MNTNNMYAPNRRATTSAVFGGLSGTVFFLGLALAIISGHFLPIFFLTLGASALMGSLASGNGHGAWGGFQGFIFFAGLAGCAVFGWWPGILVVLAASALAGALHVPMAAALSSMFGRTNTYQQPIPNPPPPAQPYQSYQEGYQPGPAQPAPLTYQEGGQQRFYRPASSSANYDEQPQAQYPQQMPPMQ